jgi:hypothetical protein
MDLLLHNMEVVAVEVLLPAQQLQLLMVVELVQVLVQGVMQQQILVVEVVVLPMVHEVELVVKES